MIWTVLRSGGEYGPDMVARLDRQLQNTPGVNPFRTILCLTDLPLHGDSVKTVPMQHRWPGWWSKMELCRPGLWTGDMVYLDLDTVLIGDLDDIVLRTKGTIVLRDFFELGDAIGSGFMRLSQEDRKAIWEEWIKRPDWWMEECRAGGDQKMMETVIGGHAQRWQDVLPGQIISYKAQMVRKGLTEPPEGTRVVCFHGKPRPWTVQHDWIDHASRYRLE